MGEVTTIGLDLAKSVFQAHGADRSGGVVFRKKLRRDQLLAFFASQPRCIVAMEACASAHYWAREIAALGHETRLIPPAYVKPFVKRQKNDMADAEANGRIKQAGHTEAPDPARSALENLLHPKGRPHTDLRGLKGHCNRARP